MPGLHIGQNSLVTDKAEAIEILQKYRELLSEQVNFESLILYGSCTKASSLLQSVDWRKQSQAALSALG